MNGSLLFYGVIMSFLNKKSLFSASLCLSFLFTSVQASLDATIGQGANLVGGTASALSLGWGVNQALANPNELGIVAMLRLLVDSLCVGAAVRGEKDPSDAFVALNLACLVGATCSLAASTHGLVTQRSSAYMIRTLLDTVQIALASKRLQDNKGFIITRAISTALKAVAKKLFKSS